MREFKRQIDRESRQSLNVYHSPSNGDGMQPFTKTSHKVIEAAMQSAAQGEVFSDMMFLTHCFFNISFFFFCFQENCNFYFLIKELL